MSILNYMKYIKILYFKLIINYCIKRFKIWIAFFFILIIFFIRTIYYLHTWLSNYKIVSKYFKLIQLYFFVQIPDLYKLFSFYLTALTRVSFYNEVLVRVIIKYLTTMGYNGLVPNSRMWISMCVYAGRRENEPRPSSPNTRKYDSEPYGHCKSQWWIYALLAFIVVEFTLRGNAARAHCSRKRRGASLSGQYGLTGRAALGLIIS